MCLDKSPATFDDGLLLDSRTLANILAPSLLPYVDSGVAEFSFCSEDSATGFQLHMPSS